MEMAVVEDAALKMESKETLFEHRRWGEGGENVEGERRKELSGGGGGGCEI